MTKGVQNGPKMAPTVLGLLGLLGCSGALLEALCELRSPFWTLWRPFWAYLGGKVPPTRGDVDPVWGVLRVVRFPLFDF